MSLATSSILLSLEELVYSSLDHSVNATVAAPPREALLHPFLSCPPVCPSCDTCLPGSIFVDVHSFSCSPISGEDVIYMRTAAPLCLLWT